MRSSQPDSSGTSRLLGPCCLSQAERPSPTVTPPLPTLLSCLATKEIAWPHEIAFSRPKTLTVLRILPLQSGHSILGRSPEPVRSQSEDIRTASNLVCLVAGGVGNMCNWSETSIGFCFYIRGVPGMKWTTLTKALLVVAASVGSAQAGLFDHHGPCCAPTCAAPQAKSCAAPCAPACAPQAVTCAAPAACAPACAPQAVTCAAPAACAPACAPKAASCAAPCAPACAPQAATCAAPCAPACAPAAPSCCAPAQPCCNSGCCHKKHFSLPKLCLPKINKCDWHLPKLNSCGCNMPKFELPKLNLCKKNRCCNSCAPSCAVPTCAAPCAPTCAAPGH